ncbi:MAG: DUF4832 domain-containing protein [Planctomycetia bacterium]|nr:DUF4832 domain-containing protein [Planctomycetia bacterium]
MKTGWEKYLGSIVFLGLFLGMAQAENIVVRPQDTGVALLNPQMGWTMHFYSNLLLYGNDLEPSDSLDWFEGCTTVYLRVPWAYLEPEEGKFNWALLDTPAQRWIAAGKKIAFRFTTSEPGLPYATPKWVFDAGAKGVRYTFGWEKGGPDPEGKLIDPVFDDPIYLEKLRTFLAAAGKRYNGNPHVAFIDVGTFGTWGEGHTGGSSRLSKEESARMAKLHIQLHKEAFPDLLLCISDDVDGGGNRTGNYPNSDYARQQGVTLRDDSILVFHAPNHWYHADMAERFWKTMPVILEHEHYGFAMRKGTWNNEMLYQSVEAYHASYMSIHGRAKPEWEGCQDVIRKINLRLGYRLQLRELEYPKEIRVGEPFTVRWKWANAGVAPCYPGGFVTMTLKDEKGGLVAVLSDETFDVKTLEVGKIDAIPEKEHTSTFTAGLVAPVTQPGTYDVYISVGERDGTPVFALPLPDDDGQRRYKVGKIIVTKH